MVWALFCFLLASAYLAEAQMGECDPREDVIVIDPDDCQAYWLCSRTSLDGGMWVPNRCPDGFIADLDDGCIEGTCIIEEPDPPPPDPPVVPPGDPPPPPPPPPPPGVFWCTPFNQPICLQYYWCKAVGGVFTFHNGRYFCDRS